MHINIINIRTSSLMIDFIYVSTLTSNCTWITHSQPYFLHEIIYTTGDTLQNKMITVIELSGI